MDFPGSMGIDELLKVMATLRDPEQGCPWDRAQTFATIAPYTLEDAYEVADVRRYLEMERRACAALEPN